MTAKQFLTTLTVNSSSGDIIKHGFSYINNKIIIRFYKPDGTFLRNNVSTTASYDRQLHDLIWILQHKDAFHAANPTLLSTIQDTFPELFI